MASIQLEPAASKDKSVLQNLMELCQHDYSEFNDEEPNEHGLFGYRYLDHYWTEAGRHPFFVRVGGRRAGFILVRTLVTGHNPTYSIAEFFILRKYRRQGVGQQAAYGAFALFPGVWRVYQEAANLSAQAFWRKVIGHYTGDKFIEVSEDGWDGPIQQFHSEGRSDAV